MKKFFFILAFCASNLSWGQNNLQFHSAVFNSIEGISNQQVIGTIVVPTGKVLKIESASVATISNSIGPIPPTVHNTGTIDAFINNMLIYSVEKDVKMPIWLPAGTYSVTIYNHAYQTYNHSFNYSGVLFNLIP